MKIDITLSRSDRLLIAEEVKTLLLPELLDRLEPLVDKGSARQAAELLSVKETAARLGVCVTTLYRRDDLPERVKIGSRAFYRRADIDELIASGLPSAPGVTPRRDAQGEEEPSAPRYRSDKGRSGQSRNHRHG